MCCGDDGPESPLGNCGVVGSKISLVLLSGELVVSVPVAQGHQDGQFGGANTGSS